MNAYFLIGFGRNSKSKLFLIHKYLKTTDRNVVYHGIDIPARKERGPLDILKALSSTIKNEPGVTEYRFRYGGIFETNTVSRKRMIALSMESGRKAAKFIVAENPELFQHRVAEPYIKAFAPPKVINDDAEVSEEILLDLIREDEVEASIKVYELLKKNGVEVLQSTKQQLLELVCFYNGVNKPDETLLETQYYRSISKVIINTWNKDGFAEKLYNEMEHDCKSYSALILGMMKHNDIKNAMKLYEKGIEEGIKFQVDVYNAIIAQATCVKFDNAAQEAFIKDMFCKMAEEKVIPNQETLNSALKAVFLMRRWFKAREFASSIYSELTEIGIQPSLATYYYLLQVYFDRSKVNNIFYRILDEVEKKLEISHPDDINFFPRAMEVCHYNFKDVSLAHRLHNILINVYYGEPLCCNLHEQTYYRSYLFAAFSHGKLEDAVELYCNLVPVCYAPELGTILGILTILQEKQGIKYLPKIWSTVNAHTILQSEKLYNQVSEVLVKGICDKSLPDVLDIAKSTWKDIDNGILKDRLNERLLSNYLKVFCRAEEKELADKVFNKAVKYLPDYMELDYESRNIYIDLCVAAGDKTGAMSSLTISAINEDENLKYLMEKVLSNFQLTEDEIKEVKNLILQKPKAPTEIS